MADRKHSPRQSRKGLREGEGAGYVCGGAGDGVQAKSRRVTRAADLSLAEHLAVLDESTELPPFGFNIAGLEQRLERRLGFEVSLVSLGGTLSRSGRCAAPRNTRNYCYYVDPERAKSCVILAIYS